MKLILENNDFKYEIENVIRIFFPMEKITVADDVPSDESSVLARMTAGEGVTVLYARLSVDGVVLTHSEECRTDDDGHECERLLALCVYSVLTEFTGYTPWWGILTGVRPSKLMRNLRSTMGDDGAVEYFEKKLLTSREKTQLALNVAKAEDRIISLSEDKSFSLYVSIPFCPTRCSYCSFVSHSVEQAKKLMPDYIRLLCTELEQLGRIADSLGLKLETVYFGGGTPTSLSAAELKAVTDAVSTNFNLGEAREYTIEAGRPDTLTREKLEVMKNAGVSRISINPQTFSDSVLEAIGRKHTSQMTVDAFRMARECGFDNINTDLIAGLPTDSVQSFTNSVEKCIELGAENITVHTLALKRSAALVTKGMQGTVCPDSVEMLNNSTALLTQAGYRPYYMYRQRNSVGNLENVGWSGNGFECLYNIYMMEEVHTVLAAGGGAVTKLKAPSGDIERIFNFKYPYEYIGRFDELTLRKNRIAEFYAENDFSL